MDRDLRARRRYSAQHKNKNKVVVAHRQPRQRMDVSLPSYVSCKTVRWIMSNVDGFFF